MQSATVVLHHAVSGRIAFHSEGGPYTVVETFRCATVQPGERVHVRPGVGKRALLVSESGRNIRGFVIASGVTWAEARALVPVNELLNDTV